MHACVCVCVCVCVCACVRVCRVAAGCNRFAHSARLVSRIDRLMGFLKSDDIIKNMIHNSSDFNDINGINDIRNMNECSNRSNSCNSSNSSDDKSNNRIGVRVRNM